MPLGKLQRPGGFSEKVNADYPRFLYDDTPFTETVSASRLRAGETPIRMAPGAGDTLVSLAGLIRPLVELHWTRAVADYNRQPFLEDDLREFLFGTARTQLGPVRPGLAEAQSGLCFYCREKLAGPSEIDHFVPWARYPSDVIENLVLADRRCNNSKRAHLAGLALVERWASRSPSTLAQIAGAVAWPSSEELSYGVARGLYAHLPHGTFLWAGPAHFEVLDVRRRDDVLALLAGA